MYLSVQHKIKLTKQLKCTLKNKAVSVKHVLVTRVSQHGDHSDWTLNSRRLGWLKMLRRKESRAGYEGLGPDNPSTHKNKYLTLVPTIESKETIINMKNCGVKSEI